MWALRIILHMDALEVVKAFRGVFLLADPNDHQRYPNLQFLFPFLSLKAFYSPRKLNMVGHRISKWGQEGLNFMWARDPYQLG